MWKRLAQCQHDAQRSGLSAVLIFFDPSDGTEADWKTELEVKFFLLRFIHAAGTADDSDLKMRIYSSASIAENPLLCVHAICS